jgi:hypothetical protein
MILDELISSLTGGSVNGGGCYHLPYTITGYDCLPSQLLWEYMFAIIFVLYIRSEYLGRGANR